MAARPGVLLFAFALLFPVVGGTSMTNTIAGGAFTHGDLDCDGGITTRDNQALQRNVLQQNPLSQTQPCTPIGDPVEIDGFGEKLWGDLDCDGQITTRDNQAELREVLQQTPLSQTEPCPDIGVPIVLGGGEPEPTSEALIAAALEAGEITYEESLLYRAYTLFADPRLPAQYASPVIDGRRGRRCSARSTRTRPH